MEEVGKYVTIDDDSCGTPRPFYKGFGRPVFDEQRTYLDRCDITCFHYASVP